MQDVKYGRGRTSLMQLMRATPWSGSSPAMFFWDICRTYTPAVSFLLNLRAVTSAAFITDGVRPSW